MFVAAYRLNLTCEGADVMHPAPGSEGRPSFTAVVGNVDSNSAKFVATTCVQTSRQEIIDDLKEMTKVAKRWSAISPSLIRNMIKGNSDEIQNVPYASREK